MPRGLVRVLQLAVGVALLAALIAIVDWDQLRAAASALSTGVLLAVAALCFAAQAVLVLRWRALLAALAVRESWARSWHTVMAGFFLTNFLPGLLGSDGLRVLLLTRSCGSAPVAVGAVAYERLMQLALYVILVSMAVLTPAPWLQPWLPAAIAAIGAGGVLALVLVLHWLGRQSVDGAPVSAGILRKLWRIFAAILIETGRMQGRMRHNWRAALSFWAGSAINVCCILAVWRLVLLQTGGEVGMAAIMLAAGGAAIAVAIPVSLNALGTFEAAIVALLGLAGVSPARAFLLALVVRAGFLAGNLFGLPSTVLLWRERESS